MSNYMNIYINHKRNATDIRPGVVLYVALDKNLFKQANGFILKLCKFN